MKQQLNEYRQLKCFWEGTPNSRTPNLPQQSNFKKLTILTNECNRLIKPAVLTNIQTIEDLQNPTYLLAATVIKQNGEKISTTFNINTLQKSRPPW